MSANTTLYLSEAKIKALALDHLHPTLSWKEIEALADKALASKCYNCLPAQGDTNDDALV